MKVHRYTRVFIDEKKERLLHLIVDKETNDYYLGIQSTIEDFKNPNKVCWIKLSKKIFMHMCSLFEKNYQEEYNFSETVYTNC